MLTVKVTTGSSDASKQKPEGCWCIWWGEWADGPDHSSFHFVVWYHLAQDDPRILRTLTLFYYKARVMANGEAQPSTDLPNGRLLLASGRETQDRIPWGRCLFLFEGSWCSLGCRVSRQSSSFLSRLFATCDSQFFPVPSSKINEMTSLLRVPTY